MKIIETRIIIHASVKDIWAVLTDFSVYKEWNSVMNIKGIPGLGEKLQVSIKINNKPMQFQPSIITFEPESELRWTGKLFNSPYFFVGEHYFKLYQIQPGQVELIHGEIFRGGLLPIVWPMIGEKTSLAFADFNKELKNRVLNF